MELITREKSRQSKFVNIQFKDVDFQLPRKRGKGDGKLILKSLSGTFLSGNFSAIMGPSGAGKSALLNIIAGFKTSHVQGDILVNGEKRNLKSFRKTSGYIMQRDRLCPVLNVMELMTFATNLKVGNGLSYTEKQQLINEILNSMGLTSEIQKTITNKLSGGEKKRLAISLELVRNPQVLFLDEPISGLDSASSFQCVSLLKKLAQEGRTIICVIHQPSSSILDMIDQLYLLAEGQCIYQGPIMDVTHFIFQATGLRCPSYHSSADFAIDVAIGKYGSMNDKLADHVKNNLYTSPISGDDESIQNQILGHKNSFQISYDEPISDWTQFCIIFGKCFSCILKDKLLFGLRLGAQIVTGIMVGLIYLNVGNQANQAINNIGLLIFLQLGLMLIGFGISVLSFPIERAEVSRQYLNNWFRLEIYYLGKTLADLPFEIMFAFAHILLVYFMTNQPAEAFRFLQFLSIGIMMSLIGQSIGLAIGAALNLRAAVFIGPPCIIPFMLFSGVMIKFKEIPTYMSWLCYASFFRYGFEGVFVAVYGYDRAPLECPHEFCYFKSPVKIMTFMNMEDASYWIDFAFLFAFLITLRVLTFFILKWKVNSKL